MSFQQLFATSADESINLFELIQCAALNDLLPSVALHLLQLSSLNWNYHEPIITASTLLIESNYLSQWNSSLCESFYGLKRVYVGSRRWFFGVSLLELVALPALRRYASGKYSSLNSSLLLENPSRAPISSSVPLSDTETIQSSTRLNPSLSQIQVSQTLRKKLQRLFVYLYPAISALDSLSIFLFRIIYMFKLLSYTSPFHLFFNIKLRRITMEDIRNQAVLESAQDVLQQRIMANSNGLKYLMCWIKRMGVVGVRWSKGALPIALAVFRFHQWYVLIAEGCSFSLCIILFWS